MYNIYYLGLSGEHRCPLGYLYIFFFGKEVMVQGATRSSESGMSYLGKSITNRIISRRVRIFFFLEKR